MTHVDDPSAVDLFDRWHEGVGDAGVDRYRTLLPATGPGPGEQYRFEVDLDECTGCKACVTACHSMNGLDEGETWRAVGLLVGGGDAAPVAAPAPVWQQHVTAACHHCLEPACLAGCPVDAYEKDPITGIVAHLDDQCIGCRYCMLTCPYEIPTYSSRLGIVRKCDMCTDRLAVGEAPACVQGCPTSAITIGVVNTAELAAELATEPDARLVPTAPRSSDTGPTTVYLTKRRVPEAPAAADDHHVVPAANHPPLVAMLVLTQLSVGAFVLSQLVQLLGTPADAVDRAGALPAFIAWATGLVAVGASVLHLGRPLVAWRAVLGLRHSWLSREILAFGVYAPMGGLTAAAAAGRLPPDWEPWLGASTAIVGIAGVACSAQLYAVTSRPFWRLDRTSVRFAAGTAATGAAGLGAAASIAAWTSGSDVAARVVTAAMAPVLLAAVAVSFLATVSFLARHRGAAGALGRSTWLLLGSLRGAMIAAILLAAAGCGFAVLAVAAASAAWTATAWLLALGATSAAAWVERGLFFTAAAPDRMPGGSQ